MVITKLLFGIALSMSSFLAFACIGDQAALATPRSVYVVPQLPASQIYVRWTPVLEAVGRQTGLCFDLHVAPTIPDFESSFLKGLPDFAFMNPYHQVMAHDAQGYIPLVADGKSKLEGIILVKADSPLVSIKQLEGKKMAFPAPNAFAASLLIRSLLARDGIDIDPVYVKSHNNVYRSIIVGDVVAGGGVNNTLEREPQEVREEVKILYRTPVFMPHPFSANPRVSPELRTKVAQAFIELAKTQSGRSMLDGIQIPEPVPVNYQNDYLPLEKLGVKKFVVNGTN